MSNESHTPTSGGVYRVNDDDVLNKEVDHLGQKVEVEASTDKPSWHPNHKTKVKGKK